MDSFLFSKVWKVQRSGWKTLGFQTVRILKICRTSGPDVMSSRGLHYVCVISWHDRKRPIFRATTYNFCKASPPQMWAMLPACNHCHCQCCILVCKIKAILRSCWSYLSWQPCFYITLVLNKLSSKFETLLILWPLICQKNHALNPKCSNSWETNFTFVTFQSKTHQL